MVREKLLRKNIYVSKKVADYFFTCSQRTGVSESQLIHLVLEEHVKHVNSNQKGGLSQVLEFFK